VYYITGLFYKKKVLAQVIGNTSTSLITPGASVYRPRVEELLKQIAQKAGENIIAEPLVDLL